MMGCVYIIAYVRGIVTGGFPIDVAARLRLTENCPLDSFPGVRRPGPPSDIMTSGNCHGEEEETAKRVCSSCQETVRAEPPGAMRAVWATDAAGSPVRTSIQAWRRVSPTA